MLGASPASGVSTFDFTLPGSTAAPGVDPFGNPYALWDPNSGIISRAMLLPMYNLENDPSIPDVPDESAPTPTVPKINTPMAIGIAAGLLALLVAVKR